MDYQTFVATEFVPRVVALLQGLRTNLGAAGAPLNNITVEEVNPDGDMRYRITATRGGRTFVGYIELTAAGVIDGQMALQLTLWMDGNGNQITTSYTPGDPVRYDDPAGIEFLRSKLTALENTSTGEMLTAAKAFLRV